MKCELHVYCTQSSKLIDGKNSLSSLIMITEVMFSGFSL